MSKPPNKLTAKLGVELSPGTITPLVDIDEKLLAHFATPDPVPDMMSGAPIANEKIYRLLSYKFQVANGILVDVRLGNNINSVLWDIPRHKRYVMPLTGNDALELFGAPDRQEDSFQF